MANIKIIIFCLLVLNTFIKSDLSDCVGVGNSKDECYGRLTDEDMGGTWKCCYRTHTEASGQVISHTCDLLSEDDYNYIDGYIESEEEGQTYDVKVECQKSYQSYICLNLVLLLNVLFCF